MRTAQAIAGTVLGLVIAGAQAQTPVPAGQQPTPPAAVVPPQSPAATTSPGAVILDYKMELLDKDQDGYVSRTEAAGVPMLAKVFDQFDGNHDGKLDRVELEAAEKARPR